MARGGSDYPMVKMPTDLLQEPADEATPGDEVASGEQRRLTRDSAFSYQCQRCTRCCSEYLIPVSPFDLLVLGQTLQLSTTEVIRRHLGDGLHLRRRDDGSCEFLNEHECGIHAGRPLVCRILRR